jgi:uncharacterized protein YndB with AHSA1/START domain
MTALNNICMLAIAGVVLVSFAGCEVESTEGNQRNTVKEATSEVSKTDANELVLIQEVSFEAPIEDVWKAYTTAEGWTAWASPKAEVDLRVGGTILTAYQGEIGGSNTNTLHIVNYVPERILTLRAELSRNWPEIMQEDAERLSNVILFDEIAEGVTRIQSYGIGYSDAPEYEQLLSFFIKANEGLYQNLRAYLETGARVDWSQ